MALFYAAFFVFAGIQLPYLPVWLKVRGLDESEIGILLAVPMVIRIAAVPLAARLIDRHFILKSALTVAAALGAAGYAVMGTASGFPALVAIYAAISIVNAPLLPLADSYALRGLNARGVAYGTVRLWGSVAFILANMMGGAVLTAFGATDVIWALAASMAATAAVTLLLPRVPDGAVEASKSDAVSGLWRSGLFVSTVIGASLIQASHAVMYGFGSLQWAAKGLGGAAIGLLWAIGVVAEILLFAISRRVIARIGAVNMILLGGGGAVLRWSVMAFDAPVALLPALQCLHALSFGATHLGAMYVLARLSDRNDGATAQGDFSAIQGVTSALAMGISGVLVARFDSYAYLAMSLAAAAGFVIVSAGRRAWREADRA